MNSRSALRSQEFGLIHHTQKHDRHEVLWAEIVLLFYATGTRISRLIQPQGVGVTTKR